MNTTTISLKALSNWDACSPSLNGFETACKLCKPLTWEVIEEIETKALIAGGADPGQALATVKKAIQALKDAGVTGPTLIPWGR